MASRPRDKLWPWIVVAILSLALALAIMAIWPVPARAATRAHKHWGGADFPISCATVREWRGAIARMTPERRAELARQFRITAKQRRQAYACLRGSR